MDSPLIRLELLSAGRVISEPVRHHGEWPGDSYFSSAYMPGGVDKKWFVRVTVQAQFDYSTALLSVYLNSLPLPRNLISSNSFSPSANFVAEFSTIAFGGDAINLSATASSNPSSYLLTADLLN